MSLIKRLSWFTLRQRFSTFDFSELWTQTDFHRREEQTCGEANVLISSSAISNSNQKEKHEIDLCSLRLAKYVALILHETIQGGSFQAKGWRYINKARWTVKKGQEKLLIRYLKGLLKYLLETHLTAGYYLSEKFTRAMQYFFFRCMEGVPFSTIYGKVPVYEMFTIFAKNGI